jgi:hypothetical protein
MPLTVTASERYQRRCNRHFSRYKTPILVLLSHLYLFYFMLFSTLNEILSKRLRKQRYNNICSLVAVRRKRLDLIAL